MYNIAVFRKLVDFVTIDKKYHFLIKLKVVEKNLLNILVFDSMFNLKAGNSYKDISCSIYVRVRTSTVTLSCVEFKPASPIKNMYLDLETKAHRECQFTSW